MKKNKKNKKNLTYKKSSKDQECKPCKKVMGIALIALSLLIIILFKSSFTGLFVGQENWISYNESLNLEFEESGSQDFVIQSGLENFNLRSLKLSGTIIGNGPVKVYLNSGGEKFLIFDQEVAATDELSSVTAYAVDVEDASDVGSELEEEQVDESDDEEDQVEQEDEGSKQDVSDDESEQEQVDSSENQETSDLDNQGEDQAVDSEQEEVSNSQGEESLPDEESVTNNELEQESGLDDNSKAVEQTIDEEQVDSSENQETNDSIEDVSINETSEELVEGSIDQTIDTNESIDTNETVIIDESITNLTDGIETNTTLTNTSANLSNLTTNLTTNLTANLTTNLTTNLNSNLTENTKGNLTGNLSLNLTGNLSANLTGNLSLNLTTNLTLSNLTLSNETEDEEEIEDVIIENETEIIEIIEPKTYHVNITYRGFEPNELDINTGDTVVWHNLREEKVPHSAMVVGAKPAYRYIRSEELSPGDTYKWTFTHPRQYIIVDGIIVTLEGKIRVTGEPIGDEERFFEELELINETVNETVVKDISFEDLCLETCNLPQGLNSSEFEIVVELENGTTLELDSIWYALEEVKEKADFSVSVIDGEGNLLDANILLGDEKINNGWKEEIEVGTYSLNVSLKNSSISNLYFEDVLINESVNKTIIIDTTFENKEDWAKSYAITLEDEARATILASAPQLHTCLEWNNLIRGCQQGWTFLKNVSAGSNYSVDLDVGSNGFAESLNITEISYKVVKEDPHYDAIIDSSELSDNGTLRVIFHHDSKVALPIFIEGRINDYTLSHNTSVAGENVTLTVYNWDNEYFRIHVGSESEVVSFGVRKEFEFKTDVKDSLGDAVNVTVEFIDSETETIEHKVEADVDSKKAIGLGTSNEKKSIDLTVAEGTYDIKVTPSQTPIDEILINDIEIFDNVTDFINIDDVNETESNYSDYLEVYAIDPTGINFTNATVTVTATGTELYKCELWNYSSQSCYGSWELFKSDLVPGENYTFTLTPNDPGFAETNSVCDGQDRDNKGSFSDSCAQSDGSRLESDDGLTESFEFEDDSARYAGVRIESVDNSINDCQSITTVEICYEWWVNDDVKDCDISVDADGGDSYSEITNSCPETSSNPGVTCSDVTSDESWTCNSFFNSSTTNALAKSELRGDHGANGDSYWDVLYFNVTYSNETSAITSDYFGFESGSQGWSDPGVDSNRQTEGDENDPPPSKCDDSGDCSDNGGYVWHLQDDSATSYTDQDFNLSAYGSVNISFWSFEYSFESNEYVRLLCDGNEIWRQTDGDYSDNQWTSHLVLITDSNCTFDSSVNIKFDAAPGLSGNGDDWFIDGINLTYTAADTTPPSSVTSLANQSQGSDWIYWTWINPADSDFSENIIFIDGSNVANTSNAYYNATNLSSSTSYTITVHTADTEDNINSTDVNSTIVTSIGPDITLPTYSSLTKPTDPTTYSSGANYQFNSTWSDNIAISTVIFEFDGTNYSDSSQSGNVWSKTISDLAVGTYNYKWYANDSSNNWNNTAIQNFTVSQAASVVNLTLNGTDNNLTINEDLSVNLSGALIYGDSGATINFYNNGTLINTGSSSGITISNLTLFSNPGIYNITVSCAATTNYSSSSETHWLTVSDITVPSINIVNPQNSSYNSTQNLALDFTAVDNVVIDSCWYTIDSGATNNTLASCANTTINVSVGSSTLTLYANDSSGNLNSDQVNFSTIYNTTLTLTELQDPVDVNFDNATFIAYYNYPNGTAIENATLVWVMDYNEEYETGSEEGHALTAIEQVKDMNNSYVAARFDYIEQHYYFDEPEFLIKLAGDIDSVGDLKFWFRNSTTFNTWSSSDPVDYTLDAKNGSTVLVTGINITPTVDPNFHSNPKIDLSSSYWIEEGIHPFTNDDYQNPDSVVYVIIGDPDGSGGNNWQMAYDTDGSGASYTWNGSSFVLDSGKNLIIEWDFYHDNITMVWNSSLGGYTAEVKYFGTGDWQRSNVNPYSVYANKTNHLIQSNNDTVTTEDNVAPQVSFSLLTPNPAEYLVDNVDVICSVSDNTPIETSYVNVTYPNSSLFVQEDLSFSLTLSNLSTTGNWTLVCYSEDTGGFSNTATQTLEVQNNAAPSSITNLVKQSQSSDWIYWNWTNPTNGDFSSNIIYLNGVNVANTSNNYYNVTSLSNSTSYTLTINTIDTSNNINTTNVSDTINISDVSPPTYSSLTKPTDPTTYSSGANYQFNSTWSDNIAISTVIFEFDGTNYSDSSQSGSVWSKTISDLAVGTYNYKWYANDSSNNWNNNAIQNFTVSQAASVVNLTLNGSNTNMTVILGDLVNISASTSSGDSGATLKLYQDGVLINSGTSSLANNSVFNSSIGTFNITVQYLASQNYSMSSQSYFVTVQDVIEPQYSNEAVSPTSPQTYSADTSYLFNITITDDIAIDTVTFQLDSVSYNVSNNGSTYYVNFTTLPAGSHTYIWIFNDTSGNEGDIGEKTYTINKAVTALFLTVSPSTSESYGTQTNVSCTANNDEVAVELTRNLVSVSNPDTSTLAANSYNYACTAATTENYTSESKTDTLVISKISPTINLTLNGADSDISINTGSQVNISANLVNPSSGSLALYQNGVIINNASSPLTNTSTYNSAGTFIINASYTGNSNYTSGSSTNTITVSSPSSSSSGSSGGGGGGGGSSTSSASADSSDSSSSDGLGSCTESWSCSSWTSCSSDESESFIQTRSCTDLSDCGTTRLRPAESRSCSDDSSSNDASDSSSETKIADEELFEAITTTKLLLQENFLSTSDLTQLEEQVVSDSMDLIINLENWLLHLDELNSDQLETITDSVFTLSDSIRLLSSGNLSYQQAQDVVYQVKLDVDNLATGGIVSENENVVISNPIKLPNQELLIPTILLLIIFVAMLSLKHVKLSKGIKKLVTLLHLALIILIIGLLIFTFLPIYVGSSTLIWSIISFVILTLALLTIIIKFHFRKVYKSKYLSKKRVVKNKKSGKRSTKKSTPIHKRVKRVKKLGKKK